MNLIFLHGWGQSAAFWDQTVANLSTIASSKAVNLPGFGGERLVSPEWGVPQYADWVEKYVEKHKLRNVVLIGHSFGGRIASLLATKNPKWLTAVILVASPALYRPSKTIKLRILIYKLIKPFIPGLLRHNFYSSELQQANKSNMGKIYRNTVRFDLTNELPKIKVPTLIIWGARDTESQIKIGYEMQTLIPGAKLEVLEGVGHQVQLENPNLFYGIIKKFIETV